MKSSLLLLIILSFAQFTSAQLVATYDDVLIPMSDGEFLEGDVYLPSSPGPYEVILIQTPYNKEAFTLSLPIGVGLNINGQPYAWVIVDWRGFYGSSGATPNGQTRGEDGYDVCDWIAAQSWHADRIGTWGPSALGGVQYHTAQEQHPNHTCAIPLVAHPQQSYSSYFYGGVLEEARLETLDLLGYGLSPTILSNPYYSGMWAFFESSTWNPSGIIIPTLQIGGWYDHNIDIMMDWYEATRTSAAAAVQNEQWLLVGPWAHGGTGAAYVGSSIQGELTYPNAEYVSNTMAWDFLNYYLLDSVNDWDSTPLITYYEMGEDVWLSSNATNLDLATDNTIFLDQNESLISGSGSGSTTFTCDPNNPSPTIGGATLHSTLGQGPYDQISQEVRNDVLSFSTDVLSQDISITGRVKLNIFVQSDQPDGDIAVRLIDEYSDGRNMLITDGIKRIRFRNGFYQADEVFMTPGQVYEIEVDLPFTNYTWKAGNKIKIMLSGNHSNRWNVNLQDGDTMYGPGAGSIAQMTIHHDALYPSSITLPGNNPILGNPEIEMDSFHVYPNPTNGVLHLGNVAVEFYQIHTIQGELLLKGTNTNEIDISTLISGIYLLSLERNGDSKTVRVVKE